MIKLFGEWGLYTGLLILGLGTALIFQELSHTSDKMKDNIELMDAINFNQQMVEENRKLRETNGQLINQIQQMDRFIQQLYNRLRKHENIPPLPGSPENNGSEA